MPLLRATTLRSLVDAHRARKAAATVLTARVDDPRGYGRIVRAGGRIAAIVEERDATEEQRAIDEINSGIYAFDLGPLFASLTSLRAGNAQGEYYLTDLVRMYHDRGIPVETVTIDDAREITGVNSRKELADVAAILNAGRNDALMAAGVTIVDPASTWIGPDVSVGADTIIHPNVHLDGRTRIGSGCVIHASVRIVDSTLDDGVVVNNFCVIAESRVASCARVGPFAHIRPQSDIGEGAHTGNLTQLKKTTIGKGSKANHLSYLGDADRRRRERRRRHDHVQLRRDKKHQTVMDGIHRQRHAAGGSGARGQRHAWPRPVDRRGRAAARSARPGEAGQQARLRRKEK